MAKRFDRNGQPLPIRTVDELHTETHDALTHLHSHAQQVKTLIETHRQAIAKHYTNDQLSRDGQRNNARLQQEAARSQAEKLKSRTEAALADLADAHKRARTPAGDSAAQLLAFQQQESAVERARKLVQSGQSLSSVIMQAGETGDVHMLAGLRRHIPSELAQAEATQRGTVAAHLEAIAKAESNHISAVEHAVRQQESAMEDMRRAVQWNHNTLQRAVEHPYGDPGNPTLIGPDKSTVTIAPEPAGLPRL